MTKALLPGVTVEEVSAAARALLQEDSRVVLATAPEKADVKLPSEDEIRAVLADAGKAPLEGWQETRDPQGPARDAADAGQGRVVAPHRRAADDGAHAVERRRGLAEAHGLQERSGPAERRMRAAARPRHPRASTSTRSWRPRSSAWPASGGLTPPEI